MSGPWDGRLLLPAEPVGSVLKLTVEREPAGLAMAGSPYQLLISRFSSFPRYQSKRRVSGVGYAPRGEESDGQAPEGKDQPEADEAGRGVLSGTSDPRSRRPDHPRANRLATRRVREDAG